MFMKDSGTNCKVQHSGKHCWPFIRSEQKGFCDFEHFSQVSVWLRSQRHFRSFLEWHVLSEQTTWCFRVILCSTLLFLNQSKSVLLSVLSWDIEQTGSRVGIRDVFSEQVWQKHCVEGHQSSVEEILHLSFFFFFFLTNPLPFSTL